MEIILTKYPNGSLVPATTEEAEKLKKIKAGQAVTVKLTQKRNYNFHKKFMAMMQIGFDAFEPAITEYKGIPVQKNFDRFRKDITIAAGFYDFEMCINGEPKAIAKSISFAKMSQEEFEQVYNACCNALLQRVLTNYTQPDLDRVVNEIVRF